MTPQGQDREDPPALLEAVSVLGWTVIVLGVLAWLVGWWLGWDEYLLLAAGCVVATAAALAFTFGRSSIRVALELEPPRLTAGQTASGRVVVSSSSSRTVLPVRMEVPVGEAIARIDAPPLPAAGQFEQSFVIPTHRRSVIKVGPVSSVRGDPLGLARRVVVLTDPRKLFVHPRTVPVGGVTAGWIRDLEGRVTNDLSNSDVAFHALREYVPGDDRRSIHWRTTARLGGRLMVRQFVDTRRAHLGLVISANADEYGDTEEFELAVSVAGSLGRTAFADRQAVTCVVGRTIIPSQDRQRFLDALAGVALPSSGHTLQHTAFAAQPLVRAASVVFLATGSKPTLGQLDGAAARFPANVRVLAVRCSTAGRRAVVSTGKLTVLDLGTLEDLPQLISSLARR